MKRKAGVWGTDFEHIKKLIGFKYGLFFFLDKKERKNQG